MVTKREASRETLERLAEAVDVYDRMNRKFIDWDPKILPCLRAYQAETTPPLRTRAEVDAEIVDIVRRAFRIPAGTIDVARLNELMAEPTAPEGETRRTDPGVYEWNRVTPELWANLAHECCADDRWTDMRIELLQAIHAVQAAAKGRL